MKEIEISSCKECPFLDIWRDLDENDWYYCSFVDDDINYVHDIHDDCPLKNNNLLVKLKQI